MPFFSYYNLVKSVDDFCQIVADLLENNLKTAHRSA